MSSYRLALQQRHFRSLWASQVSSVVAHNLLNFALIILVYDLVKTTDFANVAVALVVLAFGVPSVLFAALAGAYVDHWDRKKTLIWTNVLRAVLVLAYLLVPGNLQVILLLTFVISTITQFFVPAEAATIPKVVPQSALLGANSLFLFSFYACFMLGYGLSAPIISALGASGPFIMAAILFLLAAVMVVRLPAQPPKEKGSAFTERSHPIRDLMNSLRIISRSVDPRFAIIQLTLAQGLISIVLALSPALALAILGSSIQESSAVLVLPAGVGMVVGLGIVGTLEKRFRRRTIIRWGVIVLGSSLMTLASFTLLYERRGLELIAAALIFVLGAMIGVITSNAQTLLQEVTEDGNRGKVFGALNTLMNLTSTLPVLLAGFLADIINVGFVIGGMGVSLVTYTVVAVLLGRYGARTRARQAT